jgi:hypothetical protein
MPSSISSISDSRLSCANRSCIFANPAFTRGSDVDEEEEDAAPRVNVNPRATVADLGVVVVVVAPLNPPNRVSELLSVIIFWLPKYRWRLATANVTAHALNASAIFFAVDLVARVVVVEDRCCCCCDSKSVVTNDDDVSSSSSFETVP